MKNISIAFGLTPFSWHLAIEWQEWRKTIVLGVGPVFILISIYDDGWYKCQ